MDVLGLLPDEIFRVRSGQSAPHAAENLSSGRIGKACFPGPGYKTMLRTNSDSSGSGRILSHVLDNARQVGHIRLAVGAKPTVVSALFIFNSEDSPDGSAKDFRKRNGKRHDRSMLAVVGENDVENPVEAENDIDNDLGVVVPRSREEEFFLQAGVFGTETSQREVHHHVPKTAVDAVDRGDGGEERKKVPVAIDSPEHETDVHEDRAAVFAGVGEVGKFVAGLPETPQDLRRTPNSRYCC